MPPTDASDAVDGGSDGAADADDDDGWTEVHHDRRTRSVSRSHSDDDDADADAFRARAGAGAGSAQPPPSLSAAAPEPPMVLRDATKRILFYSPPEVLTLHLKRFAQTARGSFLKVSTAVSFPRTLDITPFCVQPGPAPPAQAPPLPHPPPFVYDLSGVVVHSGGMGAGHYVAYVRVFAASGEPQWAYASDTTVNIVPETTVLNCQAYILFYVRRPTAAPVPPPGEADAESKTDDRP